jgi:hypothetical protein
VLLKNVPMLYRILALAIFASALWGHGYTKGLAREADRRDAVELKAEKKSQANFMRAMAKGRNAAAESIKWRREARIYYLKWEELLHEKMDSQLSECVPAAQPPRGATTVSAPAPASVCMLSSDWVWLYNDALFPNGLSGNSGGAFDLSVRTGPATPREALVNHKTNAESCAEDRQRQRKLIDFIRGNRNVDATSP